MSPRPRSRPSLVPLIAVLAVLLAVLVVVLARTRGGDDAPTAASVSATAIAPERGPAARRPAAPRRPAPADRAASRTASWPLRGAQAARARVPILMYHLIADAPAGTAYPDLWVAPDRFAQQVAALRKAGFTAVTMGEAWAAWHDGGRLPRRPVVLSFDDGDITHALNAAPVLRRVGWPGVLNLAVDHLGGKGLPLWGARRLIRQGWEIGSHTTHHLDVTTLDADGLRRELVGSRRAIRDRLGVDARFFCYPAGRNDATARAAVRTAGYKAATTVQPGIASRGDDPFALPRIRVSPTTSPALLVRLARGSAAGSAPVGPA